MAGTLSFIITEIRIRSEYRSGSARGCRQVTVMDLAGKVINQYNTGRGTINLPPVSQSGVYLLKIVNGSKSYIEKIVVR